MESFWDFEGFLRRLRQGLYDAQELEPLLQVLARVSIDDDLVPRRFVSLTWWIPTFMEWQLERVAELGGDQELLKRDITRVRNALDNVLGVP